MEEALKNPNEVFRLDLSNQLLNNTQLEALTKFKNLRFLSLKNDHLKEVPKSISELTNLRVLDLSGNDFKFLPTEIKKLKKLEEIYLNNEPNADINAGSHLQSMAIPILIPARMFKINNFFSENFTLK